jgi:sporulation protein YlmC with PRC-barrel domain
MRLSELLDAVIVSESGEELGRVFDVRVARRAGGATDRADQQWSLRGLVLGKRGLAERFGFHRGATKPEPVHARDIVEWTDVLRVEDGIVTVRDRAANAHASRSE